MVKRKNHTSLNLSYKNHRNGLKKPKNWRRKVKSLHARGLKGMDPIFKRNQRYARKGHKLKLMQLRQKKRTQKKKKEQETTKKN